MVDFVFTITCGVHLGIVFSKQRSESMLRRATTNQASRFYLVAKPEA